MSLWLRGAISPKNLAALEGIIPAGQAGQRLDHLPAALAAQLTALVARHSLPGARLVRVLWFNKDEGANWGVPWHQDRLIAVAARHDLPGFGNWSQKSGLWHCEPPAALLAQMRFVRLHLDACDAGNGAMEIALGSEAAGPLPAAEAETVAQRHPTELCAAQPGDLHILPMLVLHRSRPATDPRPRRALRLDFAAFDLPAPLQWALPAQDIPPCRPAPASPSG